MVNPAISAVTSRKTAHPSRPPAGKVMQALKGEPETARGLPEARGSDLVRRGAVPPSRPLFGADDGTPDTVERSLGYIREDFYGRIGKRLPKSDPPSEKRGTIPPGESVIGTQDEAPDAVERSIEALKEDLAELEDEKVLGTTISKPPTIRPVPGRTEEPEVKIPRAPPVPKDLRVAPSSPQ